MKVYFAIVAAGLLIAGNPASAQVTYTQAECDQIMQNCNVRSGGDAERYDYCIAENGAQDCRTVYDDPANQGGPPPRILPRPTGG